MTVTTADLVSIIATNHHVSEDRALRSVKAVLSTLADAIIQNEQVHLPQLGSFSKAYSAGRPVGVSFMACNHIHNGVKAYVPREAPPVLPKTPPPPSSPDVAEACGPVIHPIATVAGLVVQFVREDWGLFVGKSRGWPLPERRGIAYTLLRERADGFHPHFSWPELARAFGRNHSTVLTSYQKYRWMRDLPEWAHMEREWAECVAGKRKYASDVLEDLCQIIAKRGKA